MALGSVPLAQAQEDEAVEEIVVTGSHIRRTEYEGRAPIQISSGSLAVRLNKAL